MKDTQTLTKNPLAPYEALIEATQQDLMARLSAISEVCLPAIGGSENDSMSSATNIFQTMLRHNSDCAAEILRAATRPSTRRSTCRPSETPYVIDVPAQVVPDPFGQVAEG
jgi:hypothetical protein